MARRLTYVVKGIKSSNLRVTVAKYLSQQPERQNDYNFVPRTKVSSQVNLEVMGVPNRGSFVAQRALVELNGKRYESASKILTGGRWIIKVPRMAFANAKCTDDGIIHYDRLATRLARTQTSGGICDLTNVVGYTDESEMLALVAKPVKKGVGQGKKTPPRSVILSVTGSLAEQTSKHFVINWDGGGKLTVARSCAQGDWDQLNVGQWIEATISRRITGEVVSALLLGTIDEPKGLSEEELADSYSDLPAADLDPME